MPEKNQSSAVTITYKGVVQGQHYEMWREELCRRFCRLDVQPSAGGGIDCQIALTSLSHLVLATASGVSGRFSRTRDLLPDGCDDFVLVSATGGPVNVIQNGRPIALSRSEMCLTEMSAPCSVGFNGNEHFTTIRIPRRALLEICPSAEERLSRPLHENSTLQAMIARYHALSSELAQSLDSVAQRMAAQHLVDLIGLLLGVGHEEEESAVQRGYSAVRLELMKTDVLNNLDRSDLTIGSIARTYGLSPRHAQRLFAQAGITFTEFLLEQRLLLARRLLGESHHRRRKISTIAYEAGFSDLSYFNRMFRKRFDAVPSDIRAAVRANGRG